jgi:hypothetical protein
LLLQERIPKKGATLHPHAAEVSAAARPAVAEAGEIMRVFTDPNTPIPEVHLLSNGQYHVMATHAGGGYSRWGNLAVTRWREDATCDGWGTFIYLRDRDSGSYWSTAYQPTLRTADHYEAIFVQARAEYRRRDQSIETHTEISVSPEDNVEIRRVTLTNQSLRVRHIEVTSYAEVVLAPLNSDLAHRTFSNLFVQTEIVRDRQAILCTRRRRTPEEQIPWMFHLMAAPGAMIDEPSFETYLAQYIGRSRTTANPVVLDAANRMSTLSKRTVRCLIRLWQSAEPLLYCQPNRPRCKSFPVSQARAKRPWHCWRITAIGISWNVLLKWRGFRVRKCCAILISLKPMLRSTVALPVLSFTVTLCDALLPVSLRAISWGNPGFGVLPSQVICQLY